MPVTKDQAQMLTSLAVACRPHGARRWDKPGIMAAIDKVTHLALADVTMAVIRAASDRTAETPGVISATSSLHWRERVAEHAPVTAPRREDQCFDCGRTMTACKLSDDCGTQARRTEPPLNAKERARNHANAARAAAGLPIREEADR